MLRSLFVLFLSLTLFQASPSFVLAENSEDVGFIKGSVWASKDNPVDGESVTLYTVLYNGSSGMLKGRVQFLDGDILLGYKDVSVESERVEDVSIKWIATEGSHTFSTRLLNGVVEKENEEPENINLVTNESGEKYTISVKQKPVPLKAQAGAEDEEGLHLEKIDSLQENISNIVPESVSNAVSEYTKGIEAFREEKTDKFIEKREEINKEMNTAALKDSEFSDIINPTEDTTVGELLHPEKRVGEALKTPLGYIKLFFLGVFIFIFKSPVVFYVVCATVLVLLVRSIIRKVRKS